MRHKKHFNMQKVFVSPKPKPNYYQFMNMCSCTTERKISPTGRWVLGWQIHHNNECIQTHVFFIIISVSLTTMETKHTASVGGLCRRRRLSAIDCESLQLYQGIRLENGALSRSDYAVNANGKRGFASMMRYLVCQAQSGSKLETECLHFLKLDGCPCFVPVVAKTLLNCGTKISIG